MKNLFEKEAYNEVIKRLDNLQATAQREWGKMNVGQMLAHCSATFEVSTGKHSPPRVFIGRVLGPLLKKSYVSEKQFEKNGPTYKGFVIGDERNFNFEKDKLHAFITEFHEGGEAKCTTAPHAFFGHLSKSEWAIVMYKHLDHHFRQFGA
ncbi:MAG: DUF1569 domain-containing protein [Bacteroidota bacterium]|nr:DUF1569 domain-containing protein [Bacteroidota bacterium]